MSMTMHGVDFAQAEQSIRISSSDKEKKSEQKWERKIKDQISVIPVKYNNKLMNA